MAPGTLKENERQRYGNEQVGRIESGKSRENVNRWLCTVDERDTSPNMPFMRDLSSDFSLDGPEASSARQAIFGPSPPQEMLKGKVPGKTVEYEMELIV